MRHHIASFAPTLPSGPLLRRLYPPSPLPSPPPTHPTRAARPPRRRAAHLSSSSATPSPSLLPRDELLKRAVAASVDRDVAAQVLDRANRALREWAVVPTDFLRAPDRMAMLDVLRPLADLAVRADGGFPQAERQRIFLGRSDAGVALEQEGGVEGGTPEVVRESLALVEVRGNFLFDTATHRDFLGAVVGAGVARERVGDIIVTGDNGAQIVVAPEVVPILQVGVTSVRTVPVKVRTIGWDELQVREPVKKAVTSVEASMRLDALASAGFGMSRSKMAAMVKAGDVLVNWKEAKSASKELKEKDMVTVRGKGRLEVREIARTAKGRFRVQYTRYM